MDIAWTFLPILIVAAPLILWTVMLVHLVQHDIPDKTLWILILLLGNLVGGIVYYFAIYRKLARKGKGFNKRAVPVFVGIGLAALAFVVIIISLSVPSSPRLSEISLGQVIQEVNNGQVQRIEVKDDELLILRKGDTQPSARSHKESGSSLREQGIDTNKVDILIKR